MVGDPIHVTVLGGYLGAGKTTLLNHVLRTADARFCVLVNDFGSINIDAELIESFDGHTMQLSNGCVCCSLAGGLADAMFAVRDLAPRPDRLLVEASGVADPAATAEYARLDGFELDGVVVVVDAETIRARAGDRYVGRHVLRQLEGADLVVLNKTDLVDGDRLAAVRRWLTERITAPVVAAVNACVPVDRLFGARAARRDPAGSAAADAGDHAHDSWTFEWSRPLSSPRFRTLIGSLPGSVVRAKGFVHLDSDPARRHVLQLVGARWTIEPGAPWGEDPPGSRLVLVGRPGHDLARVLATHFEEFT